MKTNYEIRYAAHPEDAKSYDTTRIRRDFLIEKIFVPNEVNMVYSMYDRMVVGGALPVGEVLTLEAIDPLKAPFFLTRREMGIYNVGGPGIVKAGDATFELDYKEALYLGSGDREVTFESKDAAHPAKFYFNSLTAHRNYPDRKVTKADAVVAEMGSLEGSNHRNINKMLVNFDSKVDDSMRQKIADKGYTIQELLTVASMIEKETDGTDRTTIASVIYNRLNNPGAGTTGHLNIDATIQYVLPEGEIVSEEDYYTVESPYNTYLNKGLPPGPIANPGLESIMAALNPESTNYYYYALGDDGVHHFFTSYSEHQAFLNS